MRVLGIDFGEKRIGLAISDELGTLASPLVTIQRSTERQAMDEILRAVSDREVGEVVVGVPYAMDGSEGPQARKVMKFVGKLRSDLDIPISLWDESLSTRRAAELRRGRAKPGLKKGERDRLAAAFILQDYLDSRGGGGRKP